MALVGVCALAAPSVARQELEAPVDGRGALAVLRRDGLLIPFASFNRDSWQITWPFSLVGRDIPATLEAVPRQWWGTRRPDQWRAWLTTGANEAIELRAPALVALFCSKRLGVRTTYRSRLPMPPVPVEPFPKDGVVVSGDVPVEPIETVERDSAEWSPLAVALLPEFDRVEDHAIDQIRVTSRWRHPIARHARRTLPVRLESWYRSPAGEPGWTISYIEAVRQYPPGPEDKGCGLETLVSGWLHHRDGTLVKPVDLRAKVTYCDRVGAMYMLPFGRIRPKERAYWIFQMSGWEEEWYEVVQIGPGRTRFVIEVYAGGRRRCP
jgi:hypothetical protein